MDAYSLPVGVRTVQVDGTRFLINGEPFHFKGFGGTRTPPSAARAMTTRSWSTTSR